MTDDVVVVMAWRDMGCPHRRASAAYVHDWYTRHGYPVVVEAGQSDVTFTRASAINAAVRRTEAPVIVQADPDNLVDPGVLREAAHMAAEADGLVFPHNRYLRLTPEATVDVLAGRRDVADMGPDDCDPDEGHGPNASGGVVVFSRTTWETVGGFDERFGLRAGDDAAYRYACDAWFGPSRRLPGSVVHLWHPRLIEYEPGGEKYTEQFAILAEYRDAVARGGDEVRRLVATRNQERAG